MTMVSSSALQRWMASTLTAAPTVAVTQKPKAATRARASSNASPAQQRQRMLQQAWTRKMMRMLMRSSRALNSRRI